MRRLLLLLALALPAADARLLATSELQAGAPQDLSEAVVRRLTLRGVRAVSESRLKDVLATRQSARLPWGRKRYFDPRALAADVERIRAFYVDRGFPDVKVLPPQVLPNAEKSSVEIIITLEEGEPFRVEAIRLEGFTDIPPDHFEDLREALPQRIGRPRDSALINASHDLALSELRDHGFPYARVTTSEMAGFEPRTTIVVFTAEPGQLAHFGPIEITGQATVGDNVIRRELDYAPGDLYRRSVLQNAQRRLYGLALFQFVNITSVTPESPQSPEVPTRVVVSEGKHQRLNAGVGYGSEEKGRVEGEYRHVNFLGGARSAGVRGRLSTLDRGVRVDFNQPYFFDPHLSLGAGAQQWYTYTPAYQSDILAGRAAVTHTSGSRMSWSLSILSESSTSEVAEKYVGDPELFDDLIALGLDPTTGKQEGILSAIGFDFQRSTADNPLNPRRGQQFSFHAEEAGVLLPGSYNYYALAVDGRHYQPIGDNIVAAARLQIGNIGPINSSAASVPFSKRYFLGGATSMRGWARYEVSPLSSNGLPIGGMSFLNLNVEGRARIRRNFGGVIFLDAGNVWEDSFGFSLDNLYYSIGPGLRYDTPVGPLRLDVGYQLNQISGLIGSDGNPSTSRLRFHFSIGQAF